MLATAASAAAQPVVFALPRPVPNADGWINSPVRIEYACGRATSCPDAEVVATEGARQVFEAIARDGDGTEAKVSGVVNIDYTAPAVTIESPRAGLVTTNALLMVVAQTSDALSGVASATCNGMPASVSASGRVQCVILLVPGMNDIAVEVSDRASNSGSAGLRVQLRGTPSRLRVVPDAAGVLIGGTRTFQVLDEFGVDVPGIVWRVDAPDRAQISDDGRHLLAAQAAGPVVLTASAGGLTATASVTIYPGDRVPPNGIRWKVEGLSIIQTDQTVPLRDFSSSTLTALQVAGEVARIQSMNDATGRLNWRLRPATRLGERIISARDQPTGGVVMVVEATIGTGSALVRGGEITRGTPWRYRSAGKIGANVAFDRDGGATFMELLADGSSRIVSVSGDGGLVVGRVPLPSGVQLRLNDGCVPGENVAREVPSQVGPITGTTQGIVFPIVVTEDREDYERCGSVTGSLMRTLYMASIGGGVQKVDHLRVYNAPAGSVPAFFHLYPIALDGRGGLLVPWTALLGSETRESRVVRISESGQQEFVLPTAGKIWIAGKDDLAVMTDGTRLVVFNVLTGEVTWNHYYPSGVRIADVKEGRIYMESSDKLGEYDTDGRPIPKRPGGN